MALQIKVVHGASSLLRVVEDLEVILQPLLLHCELTTMT